MKGIFPFIILVFCLPSCERQPDETPQDETEKYDLFPLNVNNEYYYSYRSYEGDVGAGGKEEIGKLRWLIFQKSENDTATLYLIEETKYDRSCYLNYFNSPDTTYPEISTANFTIYEHTHTSQLTFKNWGPFPRHSEIRDTIYEQGYPVYGSQYYRWHFIADSGLVHFRWSSGSTHHPSGYSFSLDSLNLIK